MGLFIMRRVLNPPRMYWKDFEDGPIYAYHPTRENITEQEWLKMMGEAERQYRKELTDWDGSPGFSIGMRRSMEKILERKGFRIMRPQELTYQTPLTDWERGRIAYMHGTQEKND